MARHPHRLRRPRIPLAEWLESLGGIAHRSQALAAGYPPHALRDPVRRGSVLRVRRHWFAIPAAPADMLATAASGGLLACVSAARRREWWIPPDAAADRRLHVAVGPHSAAPHGDLRVHWSRPIVHSDAFALLESVEDSLQHIADCLPHEQALTLWESAARTERLSREYLTRVEWRSPDARALAAEIHALADSGLETIFISRVRRRGVSIRQQIILAGHPVDALIGERLVVQIDGYRFHSSAADRGRDVAHDAELVARGYTVLRFTYSQLLHDWPSVDRAIGRVLAAGLHRAV